MGKATSLTVDALLSMVNASVTGASVNANGDLILTTRGGDSFDAGHVKGDTVSKILDMKPVTDAPSTYPAGFTVMSKPSGTTFGTWPADLLTIETIKYAASRTIQRVSEKTTGRSWSRTETDSDAWTAWIEWADLSKVAPLVHTHVAADITSGTLSNSRLDDGVLRGRGVVTSVVDWNTLTLAGSYDVSSPLGANTPTAYAWGVLDVTVSAANGTISQKYYPHGSPRSIFQRVRYGSTSWSVWSEVQNIADTQTTIAARFADTSSSPMLPTRLQPTAPDISGLNLLSFKQTGFYRGNNVTNAPVVSTANWWYFEVIRHDDTYVNYMAYEYFGTRVFRGYINNGVWQGWQQLNEDDTGWVSFTPTWLNSCSYIADTGNWAGLRARRIGNTTQMILANVRIPANTFASNPVDGNIANVDVLSGVPTQFRPAAKGLASLQGTAAGPMATFYLDDAGKLTVGAISPGTTTTAVHDYGVVGTFFN